MSTKISLKRDTFKTELNDRITLKEKRCLNDIYFCVVLDYPSNISSKQLVFFSYQSSPKYLLL